MNKAYKLFDSVFVKDYLKNNILPLYPQFSEIKKVKIKPHKKMIWHEDAYHVVCEYETSFLEENKEYKRNNFASGDRFRL